MTIDELLASAEQCLVRMEQEEGDDLDDINTWANAAQAYAATAQAMIMAQMTTTGENVTTGETVRWLRVDTGN